MRWPWRKSLVTIPGCDVSNWQGAIDWAKVAGGGYQFALCKASEGTTFTDPTFAANWAGAKTAGLVRGAYHYCRPDLGNTPAAEVATFARALEAAGGVAPGDVIALDAETGNGNLLAFVTGWLQAAEAQFGCKPLLYSSPSFMQQHGLLGDATLAQYGLWLASWSTSAPQAPPSWTFWALWQYSAWGSVPGITGYVDLDQFAGTADQLRAYGVPQPKPKPVPTDKDLEAMHRFLDTQPPDLPGLQTYLKTFA